MPNTEVLDEIIIGRVKPYIYAFTTNTIPNYLKVGDTYRPVSERLKEWTRYFPNLKKAYEGSAQINDTVYFRDFAVHTFLERERRRKRLLPADIAQDVYFSREFFQNATNRDIEDAVADIHIDYKNGTGKYSFYNPDTRLPEETHYVRNQTYDPRPNQLATIEKFNIARENGRTNLLMYAVMRFGKSFTSMCCAVEMNAKLVVVTSAKADVLREWKKTVESHIKFAAYDFICSDDLARDNSIVTSKLRSNRRVVVFLTLQDLQGENIKEKHKEIFGQEIDLLLIDETHFGARAEKYGEVLRAHGLEKDVDERTSKEEQETLESYNETVEKSFDAKIRIHLSGTPYKILMGSEFKKEDIIAFYQFTDIVADQKAWNKEHLLDDNYKEWENPYYGFPQMVRFAFCPNESLLRRLDELKKSGITYALSALFKPQSIRKASDGKHKKFVFEQEIFELLQAIDGSKTDSNVLGFLDYDKIKEGNMCKHIVIVLPYCASCDAMEALITANKDVFHNLGEYKIVNISGVENNRQYKTPDDVKREIEKHEKTITLTVNRMLTGSTVPQWDTMIYLKDTASPQEYDQAIFRLQSQYIKTFVNESGDTIKYNMKPQTLLVDFDPNRMFLMQEKKAQVYNVNVDEAGNSKAKARLQEELKISPIVVLNKDKVVKVTATDILQAVSDYNKDRGIIEEALEIPVDLDILRFADVKKIIESENEIGSKSGLSVRAYKTSDENEDSGELDTPFVDNEGATNNTETEDRIATSPVSIDEKTIFTKKIQSYYTRILLFAFVTNDEVISVQDIIEKYDTPDNEHIARNLGLDKGILRVLNQYCNKWALRELDYKIQDLNGLSHDVNVPPVDKANIAMRKFGKLGDAIVVTPAKICEQMISSFSDDFLRDMANNNGRILDIAGVTGEFAISLYNRMSLLNIPHDKIANAIYTIPKSSICYELTRKSYELIGLNVDNIAKAFVSRDLLEIKQGKDIDYDKIVKILRQNKPLSQITLNDNPQEGDTMLEFDAVVGNPPYQDKTIGDNKGYAPPIYHHFINIAFAMSKKSTLIHPARFLFDGGSTPKEWNKQMLDDTHLCIAKYYANSSDVFSNINIMGGLVIAYRDDYIDYGAIKQFIVFDELRNIIQKTSNNRDFLSIDAIIFAAESYKFTEQLHNDYPQIEELLSKGHKYDLKTSVLEKLDNIVFYETALSADMIGIMGLIQGKKVTRYIKNEYIVSPVNFNFYKVFVPKSNGSNALNIQSSTQVLGTPFMVDKFVGHTQTYMSIGSFETKVEAENLCKYIKSKFCRVLLGALKITQDNPSPKWKLIPMQDFTDKSDIDWSKSVSKKDEAACEKYGCKVINEIDAQLYDKYNLSAEEVQFIEKMIKPME